jgi:hypothetical protein
MTTNQVASTFADPSVKRVDGDKPVILPGEACRWFEPRIFREVDGARRYLVHRIGMSIVPTEVPYASHEWVNGAFEVVEVLTTRRAGSRPYLTHPAARVLAQAADYDNELHNAYVNRAVA